MARTRASEIQRGRARAAGRLRAAAACSLVCGAARHDQTCPGEMSKTFRLALAARRGRDAPASTCDFLDLSLLTAEYGRQILPCKALRLHRHAALPLAVLVLSQSRDGAGGRLDERALSALGRRARRDDRHAGVQYQAPSVLQADDRSPRLRRRRQPDPTTTAREGAGGGQGARARRMELSAPSRGPRLRGRRPRRCRRRRDAAPIAERLAVRT